MGDDDSVDADRAVFDAIVAASWRGGEPEPTAPGVVRARGGEWIDSETGETVGETRSAELERLWRIWAPQLPSNVRRAVEGRRGDGDEGEAGDRVPRTPLPDAPSRAQAVDTPDDTS